MLKVIHSPIHSLNMYFYVYYMLIILLIVKDTDKSLQRILFKVASLQSQFIPLLCLYFSPYSTYCSPREFNYSSTCYGLSFLLECKCQERKDYYLVLPLSSNSQHWYAPSINTGPLSPCLHSLSSLGYKYYIA